MLIKDKRIKILKQAASNKREATKQRVLIAIQIMQEKNISINFQSVSKHANVSKTWLYNDPEINAQINDLRDKSGVIKRTSDQWEIIRKKDNEIAALNEEVKALEAMNNKLHVQLEVAYGELYKLNNNLKI